MDCKNNKDSCGNCCHLDMGRGCKFCHCQEDMSAEAVKGCYKLSSYDWLEGMPQNFPTDVFEVRFKNTRKSFFQNVNNLPLEVGDIIAVEASPGHDIGIISMNGDIVARQMRRMNFNPQNGEFKKIYRKAKAYDIEKWQEAIGLEHETMIRSRQIAAELGLNMKIGDVEYQGDKIKAIFYYIADERVDFRELIKIFAEQFRVRIEMKQVGARQEAGRIGGLGSCGRELCCSSWIAGFVSITTNSARQQEISLNPQKLAGQCGKLKCCLVYEVDTYIDARKDIPRVNQPLQTLDGDYYLVKTDILSHKMWFSADPHSTNVMHQLSVDRVKEIQQMNSKGKKADQLTSSSVEKVIEPTFVNVVGEDSLTRFDPKSGGGQRGRSLNNRRNGGTGGAGRVASEPNGNKGESNGNGAERGRSSESRRSGGNNQRMASERGSGGAQGPKAGGSPERARDGQPSKQPLQGERQQRPEVKAEFRGDNKVGNRNLKNRRYPRKNPNNKDKGGSGSGGGE